MTRGGCKARDGRTLSRAARRWLRMVQRLPHWPGEHVIDFQTASAAERQILRRAARRISRLGMLSPVPRVHVFVESNGHIGFQVATGRPSR